MKIFDINKINKGLDMADIFEIGDKACIRDDLIEGEEYDGFCWFAPSMNIFKGRSKEIVEINNNFLLIEEPNLSYAEEWEISYSMIDWEKTIEVNLKNQSQIETDIHLEETLSPIHVVDVLEDVLTLDFYDTFENTEAKKLIQTCIKALKRGE